MAIKGERGCILPAVALGDISSRIVELIRTILYQVFEVATPIVNMVGVTLILLGLLLWFGARQEWNGWRLISTGIIMLIFIHFVVPFLLSFL